MTKLDTPQIKPMPRFDSQKWLRKVRAEIHRETEGMTPEQRREYFHQAAEQDEQRRAEKKKFAESGDSENEPFDAQSAPL